MDEVLGAAVEDDAALVEGEEAGAWVDAVVWDGFHVVGGLVEAVRGEGKGVLQTVRDEQRGGAGDVTLLDDEFDDGGGGDGVQAAGGAVVEQELGAGDDGARDRNAAAHAAGELGGELVDGFFEFDEVKGFDDAFVGFFFGHLFFVKPVRDVVFDAEGVEEGAFLEDHADMGAELEHLAFGEFA